MTVRHIHIFYKVLLEQNNTVAPYEHRCTLVLLMLPAYTYLYAYTAEHTYDLLKAIFTLLMNESDTLLK